MSAPVKPFSNAIVTVIPTNAASVIAAVAANNVNSAVSGAKTAVSASVGATSAKKIPANGVSAAAVCKAVVLSCESSVLSNSNITFNNIIIPFNALTIASIAVIATRKIVDEAASKVNINDNGVIVATSATVGATNAKKIAGNGARAAAVCKAVGLSIDKKLLSINNITFNIISIPFRADTTTSIPVNAARNTREVAASSVNITDSGVIAASSAIDGATRAINTPTSGVNDASSTIAIAEMIVKFAFNA